MTLSLLLALTLQSTALPPAVAPPPQEPDVANVLATIDRMFAGLKARNGTVILAEVRTDGQAVVVLEKADGTKAVKSMPLSDFASGIKPGPEAFEEKLVGRPSIEMDGDMAMVWAPYVLTVDGKLSHCGTNHFGLIREGGAWKVASILWTQRKTDCPSV